MSSHQCGAKNIDDLRKRVTTAAAKPIRILLVDDHAVFRVGVRMIIQSKAGMSVVAEAGNCEEALAKAHEEQPDVILLDLDLGENNGISLISDLLAAASHARIIILTGVRDIEAHRKAILHGAMGIVRKEKTPDLLIKAIERVNAGEAWLDPVLMADVIGEVSHATRAAKPDLDADNIASLTRREMEVIAYIGSGLNTKEIAERLFISEKTVNHHLGAIFSKLGVSGRAELIVFAYRHHLCEPPR